MEQKVKRSVAVICLAVLAVLAFVLRRWLGGPLVWVSVAAVVLFAVYAGFLRPRKTYIAGNGRGNGLQLIASLAAAGLALMGALLRLQNNDGMLLAGLLAATALCWAVTGLQRQQAKQVSPWFFIVPVVFYGAELVYKFRLWGGDPLIQDYCYELLALIATMCAVFHMGGFCFDIGQRRMTVFFCMSGVYFTCISLADASGGEIAVKLAAILWLTVNLWQILRPGKQKRDREEEQEA